MGGCDLIREHFGNLSFYTGVFVAAWSWVLVYFGVVYTFSNESPLQRSGVGTPHVDHGPRSFVLLLAQYIVVVMVAVFLSKYCQRMYADWIMTLVTAVEFFPAPIFSELLLSYLGQFPGDAFGRGLRNVFVCWVVAASAHILPPMCPSLTASDTSQSAKSILRKSTAFCLGLAWNSWIRSAGLDGISLCLYLVVLCGLAARLIAPPPREEPKHARHAELIGFTMRVAVAFAFRDWLVTWIGVSWIGLAVSLLIVAGGCCTIQWLILSANLEHAQHEIRAHENDMGPILLRLIAVIPCAWCMYPWLPLGLLAGRHSNNVKDRWISLVADTCAITASVVLAYLQQDVVFWLATRLKLCSLDYCPEPLMVVALEVIASVLLSTILFWAVNPLAPPLSGRAETPLEPQVRLLAGF